METTMCLGALTHLIYLKQFFMEKWHGFLHLLPGGEGWGDRVMWEMQDLFRAGTLWAQAEESI